MLECPVLREPYMYLVQTHAVIRHNTLRSANASIGTAQADAAVSVALTPITAAALGAACTRPLTAATLPAVGKEQTLLLLLC